MSEHVELPGWCYIWMALSGNSGKKGIEEEKDKDPPSKNV